MEKQNYQLELEKLLDSIQGTTPALLLHSCCAPCSSYVIEYLSKFFELTIFYYNPNITDLGEYQKRVAEQQRLLTEMKTVHPIHFLEGRYHPEQFYEMSRGKEQLPEGGVRCYSCYEMRLRETARMAKEQGFDFFGTTLSVSPYKNAQKLNEIGGRLASEYGIPYLFSDFKKKNGYKRSIELSTLYGLYRQDYCGCEFSKQQRAQQKENAG